MHSGLLVDVVGNSLPSQSRKRRSELGKKHYYSGRQTYEFPKPKGHIIGKYLDVELECPRPRASERLENGVVRVIWVPSESPSAFPYRDWTSRSVMTLPKDERTGCPRGSSS